MSRVIIDGFQSKEEARAFCEWYSGQGEQDASYWFEAANEENPSIRSSIMCKGFKDFDTDDMIMEV